MEINGGSPVSYLACTPCIPLFCTLSNRLEAEGFFDFQGRRGIASVVRRNLCLGKTKTPQTVTLQVKIERGQKSIKNQHTVPDHVLAYPLRRNFPAQKKQLNFHLQCYHLQCFSFAQFARSYSVSIVGVLQVGVSEVGA